jgi:hypothetical protein
MVLNGQIEVVGSLGAFLREQEPQDQTHAGRATDRVSQANR